MALNYLQRLLRFGPGFTCWAIWESWAACSVVPCTAAVCEGVTELVLPLLCTSSIISCKKSNEWNSVNDPSEQRAGAQPPPTLYRISVQNAFSLVWTFLISSLSFDATFHSGTAWHFLSLPLRCPKRCQALPRGWGGTEAVGAVPPPRPGVWVPSPAPGTPPRQASEPSAARSPVSERLATPVPPDNTGSPTLCLHPFGPTPRCQMHLLNLLGLTENKAKPWGLGRKPRWSIYTKEYLAPSKILLKNVLPKLPAKPIFKHLKVYKNKTGIQNQSTEFWILNPAKVTPSPHNTVSNASLISETLYLTVQCVLTASPLQYWGIQWCQNAWGEWVDQPRALKDDRRLFNILSQKVWNCWKDSCYETGNYISFCGNVSHWFFPTEINHSSCSLTYASEGKKSRHTKTRSLFLQSLLIWGAPVQNSSQKLLKQDLVERKLKVGWWNRILHSRAEAFSNIWYSFPTYFCP